MREAVTPIKMNECQKMGAGYEAANVCIWVSAAASSDQGRSFTAPVVNIRS